MVQMIDHYEKISDFESGGMGEVYLARDIQTTEIVVIKTLKDARKLDSETKDPFLKYFIREAQILLELEHHNIVSYKGAGNFQGMPYLVMEYIKGTPLSKELKKEKKIRFADTLQITYCMATALEYGHNKKLVHRDVKPSNILLPESGKPIAKLIDFGIAKFLDECYESLGTPENVPMGTPPYMSPEQVKNGKYATHQSDIYSLGATLYHMLAQKPPFNKFSPPLMVMKEIVEKKLTPLKQHRSDLPSAVYKIVAKAMAYDVKERYQSATELKKAIADFIKSLS